MALLNPHGWLLQQWIINPYHKVSGSHWRNDEQGTTKNSAFLQSYATGLDPEHRAIKLNANYVILLKNPRTNKSQIIHLAVEIVHYQEVSGLHWRNNEQGTAKHSAFLQSYASGLPILGQNFTMPYITVGRLWQYHHWADCPSGTPIIVVHMQAMHAGVMSECLVHSKIHHYSTWLNCFRMSSTRIQSTGPSAWMTTTSFC